MRPSAGKNLVVTRSSWINALITAASLLGLFLAWYLHQVRGEGRDAASTVLWVVSLRSWACIGAGLSGEFMHGVRLERFSWKSDRRQAVAHLQLHLLLGSLATAGAVWLTFSR